MFCLRCGYTSPGRSHNVKKHLNNKRDCAVKYLDISRSKILKNYEKCCVIFVTKVKYDKNMPQYIKDLYNAIDTSKLTICDQCGAKLKCEKNLYRHKKLHCSERNNIDSKVKELERQIELLQSSLISSQSSQNNITDNSSNLNVGNIQNANTIHNGDNVQNNVQNNYLCAFGKEDVSHITPDEWHHVIKSRRNGVNELMKLVYTKNPKNQNVFIKNRNKNSAYVFNPPIWDHRLIKHVAQDAIQAHSDYISTYMEHNGDKISSYDIARMDEALVDIQRDEKTNTEACSKAILLFTDDNLRKNVVDNYKSLTGEGIP